MAKTKAKPAKVASSAKLAGKIAPKLAAKSKAPAKPVTPAKPTKPVKFPKSTPVKPSRAVAIATPPPAPAVRDELGAPRDVARLLRYGERFGAHRIDVRWLPLQLPVASGALALLDPAAPKAARVLDRPAGSGMFRVMLSLSRDDAGHEELAAIVVHVGRPPIARWTVAHWKGGKRPASADVLPSVAITSGWLALVDAGAPGAKLDALAMPATPAGHTPIEVPLVDGRRALAVACRNGSYAAYWAIDAADKPVCLVVDFDPFTQKEWKARPAS